MLDIATRNAHELDLLRYVSYQTLSNLFLLGKTNFQMLLVLSLSPPGSPEFLQKAQFLLVEKGI